MVKASGIDALLPGIPTRAILIYPNDVDGIDCGYFCQCDDGSEYAVKDSQNDARIPHSEWFCTRLGERAGLLSPPPSIVLVRDEECFGSRWETAPEEDWWVKAAGGSINFGELAGGLSRILAFDLFVHNGDRHLKNYLVRRQRTKHTVLAYDYSQAWLCNGIPPPDLPMHHDDNTVATYRYLRHHFGDFIDMDEVRHVIGALRSVTSAQVGAIILEHPENWLTEKEKSDILTWWDSARRLDRLTQIEGGIEDGSLL